MLRHSGFVFRERALALERAEKERQELEKKKEKELQQKREMDRLREQVGHRICNNVVCYDDHFQTDWFGQTAQT